MMVGRAREGMLDLGDYGRKVMRRVNLGLALLALMGCQKDQPVYVVNYRANPVQLTYRAALGLSPQGQPPSCEWEWQKPGIFPTVDTEAISRHSAHQAPQFAYDPGHCEIRITLPAMSSAYIALNELCSSHWPPETIAGPPGLNYIRIESNSGSIELSGWEVTRVLIERRGWISDGDCRYEIR
jgi:hypothetical protein